MAFRKIEKNFAAMLFNCFMVILAGGCCLQVTLAYGVREQLWIEVQYPVDILYHFKILPARDFGGVIKRTLKSIPLVAADPWQACTKKMNPKINLKDRVALVVRGECSFITKALIAQSYGAKAIIITNYDENDIDMWIDMADDTTGRKKEVLIPAFYMLGKDGHKIKDALLESPHKVGLINIPANVSDISNISQPNWDLW